MEMIDRRDQQLIPVIDQDLFLAFVSWIDRSEKTTRSYLTNLRQFMVWLRYSEVTRPERNDIINYREWLLSEHDAIQLDPGADAGWSYRTDSTGATVRMRCTANTVAQYLRVVCQFFSWLAANGLYPDIAANIHAPKLRNDAHKKEAMTAAEILAIEQSIDAQAAQKLSDAHEAQKDHARRIRRTAEQTKRLRAIYLLAVNAGLRTIEISRANVRDLEIKGNRAVLVIWGKGHSEPDQRKALAPEVAAAIRDYLRARPEKPAGGSPLFTATGNRSGGKRLAATTISRLLKDAMVTAGFDSPKITAHSLRHSCGTAIMDLTGNLYAAQTYMRHSNPATTEIYLHTDTEKADAQLAGELYSYFHGSAGSSGSESPE